MKTEALWWKKYLLINPFVFSQVSRDSVNFFPFQFLIDCKIKQKKNFNITLVLADDSKIFQKFMLKVKLNQNLCKVNWFCCKHNSFPEGGIQTCAEVYII